MRNEKESNYGYKKVSIVLLIMNETLLQPVFPLNKSLYDCYLGGF